jgi:autotransporter-associated beta strand protein
MTMTYSKFLTSSAFAAAMAFACAQSANAQTTVNFTTLSSGDGIANNSLLANGSAADLTVARTFVGGDFLYAISYSGLDFDGVAGLDTLNFTVRVDAKRNGTIAYGAANTSTATLGPTSIDTTLSTGAGNLNSWNTLSDVMISNSSLIFTVESASVSTGQSVDPASFTGLFMKESRSSGHQTVIGLGTGLAGYAYNNDQTISGLDVSTLYVSNGKGLNDAVGVRDINFSITVIGALPSALVWDGSTDSDWTNPDSDSWSGETYDDGDDVSFLTAGAGSVTISGTVAPASVLVSSTGDYTFSGDAISGTSVLTKSGTSVLTLNSANTYTGVTTIDGGTLTVGDDAALGSIAGNTVVIGAIGGGSPVPGGTLRMEGGISLAEVLDITGGTAAAPALWSTAGNNTVTGAITGGGRIQTDVGTLTLSGGLTHTGNSGVTGDVVIDTAPVSVTGMNFAGDTHNLGDPLHVAGRAIVLGPITGTHDWDYSQLFFSAIVELGANDIMPTDAEVRFGWSTVANSFSKLDLKSFDQTVVSIAMAANSLNVGGDVEITDSTGSGTLTVNQTTATEYQGRLTGGLALIKAGGGTLTLNNLSGTPTSNTGSTSVTGGTLSLSSADLDDASTVSIATGAVLDLTHSDIDDVAVLNFNGVAQANGTYAVGNSGGYITGTGSVRVGGAVAAGYDSWAAGFAGLTDTDPALDFDGGSLETGIEFVLAGDPTDASDDLTVAPTSTYTGTALEFDYRRSDLANDDANTTIIVQYGSDLSGWDPAVHNTDGVTITVTDDHYGTGIDRVVVSLPESLADGSKLFARLNVTTAP